MRIVESYTKGDSACCNELDNIANDRVTLRFPYFVAEHPRVAADDASILVLPQDDLFLEVGLGRKN